MATTEDLTRGERETFTVFTVRRIKHEAWQEAHDEFCGALATDDECDDKNPYDEPKET